jgi:hypothetical protein
MEHASMSENSKVASSKMISLDYLFGEGEQMQAYQVVRFSPGEAWLVLEDGVLISTLLKQDKIWIQTGEYVLDSFRADQIGKFIDQQHFNLMPDKIKTHWFEAVEEVIMQNDSLYLVICKPDIEFKRFENVFAAFISELVEEAWAVEFKVYNAEFSDEFLVRVF